MFSCFVLQDEDRCFILFDYEQLLYNKDDVTSDHPPPPPHHHHFIIVVANIMTSMTRMQCQVLLSLCIVLMTCSNSSCRTHAFVVVSPTMMKYTTTTPLFSSTAAAIGQPTELPDSLEDAAELAAQACVAFVDQSAGPLARCRIDFDTSVGDETYTILKSSTEFMQKFTTFLCYAMIPGIQDTRMKEMMRLSESKAALRALGEPSSDDDDDEVKAQRQALIQIIRNDGRDIDASTGPYDGPVVRIYFPDEGNAALARRDWAGNNNLVPPCVQFSSCGGVQVQDVSKDVVVMFFCPKASESEAVEKLLALSEEKALNLKLTIFVNPNLVDMGVTGFGMAGRLLRERLIDPLVQVYYLRTLSWGALTRLWPRTFSVWQEDENQEGGYKLISSLDRLPSNPEVEDIYDVENGFAPGRGEGGGFLDQFGDFVNGMMKL